MLITLCSHYIIVPTPRIFLAYTSTEGEGCRSRISIRRTDTGRQGQTRRRRGNSQAMQRARRGEYSRWLWDMFPSCIEKEDRWVGCTQTRLAIFFFLVWLPRLSNFPFYFRGKCIISCINICWAARVLRDKFNAYRQLTGVLQSVCRRTQFYTCYDQVYRECDLLLPLIKLLFWFFFSPKLESYDCG